MVPRWFRNGSDRKTIYGMLGIPYVWVRKAIGFKQVPYGFHFAGHCFSCSIYKQNGRFRDGSTTVPKRFRQNGDLWSVRNSSCLGKRSHRFQTGSAQVPDGSTSQGFAFRADFKSKTDGSLTFPRCFRNGRFMECRDFLMFG